MKTKSKLILIIIAVFLVLCLCSSIILGGVYLVTSSVFNQSEEIKESVLFSVCNSHGNISETEYRAWFSDEFRENSNLEETKLVVSSAFPEDYMCSDLESENIFDMFLNGQSISISLVNGVNKATLIIPQDEDEYVSVELIKVGKEWEVDSIAVTLSSGK